MFDLTFVLGGVSSVHSTQAEEENYDDDTDGYRNEDDVQRQFLLQVLDLAYRRYNTTMMHLKDDNQSKQFVTHKQISLKLNNKICSK